MIISWDGCFFGYEKSTFWGKNIMVCCKKVLNWNTWFPRPILARPLQSWLLGQSYQKGLLALEDERNQTIPCLLGNESQTWDCVTNFSVFNRDFSAARSDPMRKQFKIVHKILSLTGKIIRNDEQSSYRETYFLWTSNTRQLWHMRSIIHHSDTGIWKRSNNITWWCLQSLFSLFPL